MGMQIEAQSGREPGEVGLEAGAWTGRAVVAAANMLRGTELDGVSESRRNEHAQVFASPFFALRHLCPDLWHSDRPVRLVCGEKTSSLLASVGGRWVTFYAKALQIPAHIGLEFWTDQPVPKGMPPRGVLFHRPQTHIRKPWLHALRPGLPIPDVLVLYSPAKYEKVQGLIEALGEWPVRIRTLIGSLSTAQAVLFRALLVEFGYTVGPLQHFFVDDQARTVLAPGHVWFEVRLEAGALKRPELEDLEDWTCAYQTLEMNMGNFEFGENASDSVYGILGTRDGVEMMQVGEDGGVRLDTGQLSYMAVGSGGFLKHVLVDNPHFSVELHQKIPVAADFTESVSGMDPAERLRYAGMRWLGWWRTVFMSGGTDGAVDASTTGPSAPDPTEVAPAAESAPAEPAPPAAPPRMARSWQLSRRAGTTDVLAMAGILGRPGLQADLETASTRVVDWLARKGYAGLSATESGQTSTPDGEATVETDGKTVWALRFDDRRQMAKGAIWRVEMTLLTLQGQRCAIGVRLYQLRSTEDAQPPTSGTPAVVAELGRELGLSDGGAPMLDRVRTISAGDDVDWLKAQLLAPDRAIAIVIISSMAEPAPAPGIDRLAARLVGLAHVVVVDDRVAWTVSSDLGHDYGIYGNAVRVYRPRPGVDDVPKDHPLWTMPRGDIPLSVANRVAEAVSAISLEHDDLDDRVPPFRSVRQQLSASRIEAMQAQTHSLAATVDEERARHQALVEQLERARSDQEHQIGELRDQVRGLQDEVKALRRERDAALDDVRSLRRSGTSAWHMQLPTADDNGDEEALGVPDTWDGLEEWVDQHLADRLVVHPLAAKAARESQFEDIAFVYQALSILGNEYVAMRTRGPDEEHLRGEFDAAIAELGVECSPVGSAVDDHRFKQDYRRRHEGKTVKLDMHLKRGAGTDPTTLFRIYFHFCEATQRVIVGHMPGHLTNRKTRNA